MKVDAFENLDSEIEGAYRFSLIGNGPLGRSPCMKANMWRDEALGQEGPVEG